MKKEELDKILIKHKLWISSENKEGTRANLSSAFLVGANLSNADLNGSNMLRADLRGANLIGVNINGATLILTVLKI